MHLVPVGGGGAMPAFSFTYAGRPGPPDTARCRCRRTLRPLAPERYCVVGPCPRAARLPKRAIRVGRAAGSGRDPSSASMAS